MYDGTNLGKEVVRELLVIGKASLSFGVLSGSSNDTVSLAHHGYPDLNHTVYRATPIYPLNTKAQVEEVVKQLESTIDLDKLFLLTGGVRRDVATLLQELVLEDDSDNRYYLTGALRTVFTKLFLINGGSSTDIDIWNQRALSHQEVTQILESHSKSVILLNSWLDSGKLLKTITHSYITYKFLIPQHSFVMKQYFNMDLSRMELLALEVTLQGWGDCGSVGAVSEDPIRRRITKIKPFEGCTSNNRELSFAVKVDNNNLKICHVPSLSSLEDLKDELFQCKRDFELNGILISKKSEGKYEAHLLQIKTGVLNKAITLGKNAQSGDDTQLLYLIHQAKHGWENFQRKIKALKLEGTIEVASFTLFTTKQVNQDVKSYAVRNKKLKFGSLFPKINFFLNDQETFKELFRQELTHLGLIKLKTLCIK